MRKKDAGPMQVTHVACMEQVGGGGGLLGLALRLLHPWTNTTSAASNEKLCGSEPNKPQNLSNTSVNQTSRRAEQTRGTGHQALGGSCAGPGLRKLARCITRLRKKDAGPMQVAHVACMEQVGGWGRAAGAGKADSFLDEPRRIKLETCTRHGVEVASLEA
jgi:hypothetical protein